jgi:hypothetical protein
MNYTASNAERLVSRFPTQDSNPELPEYEREPVIPFLYLVFTVFKEQS